MRAFYEREERKQMLKTVTWLGVYWEGARGGERGRMEQKEVWLRWS